MGRREAAEPGRGSKGLPSSAATAAIERAKTRQGTRLRAAVCAGFAYWPRGLLWRVGVAGAEELGGRVLRVGLRLHAAGLVDRIRSEEHTSELQSLMRISYAVFCLKNKKISHNSTQ